MKFKNLLKNLCLTSLILLLSIYFSNAQCTMGFDLIKNLPNYCTNSDTVVLQAWDTTFTGGCLITPGLIITITLDAKSAAEDFLIVYENGKVIGSFSASSFWPGSLKLLGCEFSTSAVYSFKFCDKGKDGIFPYTVYDRNHMKLIASGTILGSDSCTTVVFPKLTGKPIFSGSGVKTYNNGFAMFDPKAAGPGTHIIQYLWDDEYGFRDSVTKTIEVRLPPDVKVNDTTINKGSSVTLTATGASTYKWSTNQTTSSIVVTPDSTTKYIVTGTDTSGCSSTDTALVTVVTGLPGVKNYSLILFQNLPNPCNNSTIITYGLGANNYIKLEILDLLGREVKFFDEGRQNAGIHKITVLTNKIASGLYFYTLTTDNARLTRKMLITHKL